VDRLCRVYKTRPDLLGYGHDYTPSPEPAAYAGPPAAPLAVTASEQEEEAATDRGEFLGALGAAGLAELLDRARNGAARLGRKLGASNLGPVTLEQLELRVAGLAQAYERTPRSALLPEVLAQHEEVEDLLGGAQPLRQRRGLYRVAGQLSVLLGGLSFALGDYATSRAHLLTAWQLAEEVGDHTLRYRTRVEQSTVALWAGDLRAARDLARDGQRYATTGTMEARLAARCEARACARMRDQIGVKSALRRAERAMPSQQGGEPDSWWVFIPGDLALYTATSLLWLGEPGQAEPHAREAIASLQWPCDQALAQINLAICLVGQDQPDEGIRLATHALGLSQEHEVNLQQARELLAALRPAHRQLPAARDFAEQLQAIRASRPTLTQG